MLKEVKTIATLDEIWTPGVYLGSPHESTSCDPVLIYYADIASPPISLKTHFTVNQSYNVSHCHLFKTSLIL